MAITKGNGLDVGRGFTVSFCSHGVGFTVHVLPRHVYQPGKGNEGCVPVLRCPQASLDYVSGRQCYLVKMFH